MAHVAIAGFVDQLASSWWLRVLAVFAASRLITTAFLLYFASIQQANPWTGPRPGYVEFASMWDANWYHIIAQVGYPTVLPMTDAATVGENAWAFMPAYPALVRLLMLATGLDFGPLAVAVAVIFAAATCLLLYRLFQHSLGAHTALFTVVLFCVAPLSPIYQLAYAESMHAFFLVLALLLLQRRQYWLMIPVIAVMALTRPSGLAFALALLLHLGYRWFTRRRDPFPRREVLAVCVVGLFSAFMGVAWLLVAGLVTGSPTAYTDTELAWRAGYGYVGAFVPFTAWLQGAHFWLQFAEGPFIVAGGAAFIVGLVAVVASRVLSGRVGPDVRFWTVSYLLYLLAVFFPQSSTFRLLVPLFPALGIIAQPRSRVYRVVIVVLFIAGQWLWIDWTWWVDGSDWSVP